MPGRRSGSRSTATPASSAMCGSAWRRRTRAGGWSAGRCARSRAPSWMGWRRRGRIGRRRASGRRIPTASPARPRRRDHAGARPDGRGAAGRRPRPAPHPRGADARRRSAAGVLPPRREHPRGRAGARRGDRARGRRSARLLLGPRLRRRRPGRDRRRARRSRQRDPPRGPARPPHRHLAPLRRPSPAGRADDAAARVEDRPLSQPFCSVGRIRISLRETCQGRVTA